MTDIPSPLTAVASRHGDLPAFVTGDIEITWSQVNGLVNRLADKLTLDGVRTGNRIAVAEHNRTELPILMLANIRIGAVTALLNPRYPLPTLSEMAAQAGCSRQAIRPEQSAHVRLQGLKPLVLPTCTELMDAGENVKSQELTMIESDQPATIVFTSGSSALPKPALHSFSNHYYSALGSNRNLPVEPGDRWLLSLPLFHVGALGIVFRCLLGGGTVVFGDHTDDLASQIGRHKITHLSVVPTQLRRLLESPDLNRVKSSLKAILLGGGPIPVSLVRRAAEQNLPIRCTYGLTEMTSQVATATLEAPASLKVLGYREAKIDAAGEILVKGETLFLGYAIAERVHCPVDTNGWFHTGDSGVIEGDGCLAVTGRMDSMFISGGENIQPEQIESALIAVDGIEDALVVPADSREYGQRPVAFLRCRPAVNLADPDSDLSEEERFGLDHNSLSAELAKTLPRFMLPVAYYPWPRGHVQAGIKADRAFFKQLAAKLYRSRE
jgi:O-succinylbenzoic acid--CoA ligase